MKIQTKGTKIQMALPRNYLFLEEMKILGKYLGKDVFKLSVLRQIKGRETMKERAEPVFHQMCHFLFHSCS